MEGVYLKDKNQKYVINPSTKQPYIVPVGYNPEVTVNRFRDADISDLLGFKTNGQYDLQRNFKGRSHGGFVADFTAIASFDFALACRSQGRLLLECELGGGVLNMKNKYVEGNKKININGFLGNNPYNVPHMEYGDKYFNKHFFKSSTNIFRIIGDLDDILKPFQDAGFSKEAEMVWNLKANSFFRFSA